jgi:hypothetical protein
MEQLDIYREIFPQEIVANSDFGPETISRIHQLLASFTNPEAMKAVEDGDIKIEFLNQKPGKIHYILILSGVRYFLKEVSTLDNKSAEGGREEFEDAQEASDLLLRFRMVQKNTMEQSGINMLKNHYREYFLNLRMIGILYC